MLRLLTGNVTRVLGSATVCAATTPLRTTTFGRFICSAVGQNHMNLLSVPRVTLNQWINPVAATNGLLQSGSHSTELRPQVRTVTKFSLIKGKRKSVKAVLKRFKRLDWGIWIRTHSGRNKKLFKKSPALKRRLRQHVFTNATQSWLLDKMVTGFWRRPKHYIDDPYEPYHKRDEYFATKSRGFKI